MVFGSVLRPLGISRGETGSNINFCGWSVMGVAVEKIEKQFQNNSWCVFFHVMDTNFSWINAWNLKNVTLVESIPELSKWLVGFLSCHGETFVHKNHIRTKKNYIRSQN